MRNEKAFCRVANLLIVLLTTSAIASPLFAQKVDRPDFTGQWVLDLKKSDPRFVKLFKGKLKKTERLGSRLEIDHKDPTIILTETFAVEELDSTKNVIGTRALGRLSTVYYTNGKGETNKLFGPLELGSTTTWKGDTIVVVCPDRDTTIQWTTFEFALSKDGSELRITEKMIQQIPAVGFNQSEISSMGGKSVYFRYKPAVNVDK